MKRRRSRRQRGEPQVRGRQPRSSELITPSISPSDPERKEGGREREKRLEGAGGCATATGKGKLIIGLWQWLFGEEIWNMSFLSVFVCTRSSRAPLREWGYDFERRGIAWSCVCLWRFNRCAAGTDVMCFHCGNDEWAGFDIPVADLGNLRPGAPSSPTTLALFPPPSARSLPSSFPKAFQAPSDLWRVYPLPLWVCINNNVACHCA